MFRAMSCTSGGTGAKHAATVMTSEYVFKKVIRYLLREGSCDPMVLDINALVGVQEFT